MVNTWAKIKVTFFTDLKIDTLLKSKGKKVREEEVNKLPKIS